MPSTRMPPRSVVARIAAILTTFRTGSAHSITEIARLTGLPISTAHRLANELASWNLLHRRDDAMFEIGPMLRRLGDGTWSFSVVEQKGPPLLTDLSEATDRRVRLGVLLNGRIVYMEKRPGFDRVTAFSRNATLPAHATALGKVLLAFAPQASIAHIVRPMMAFTPRTINSIDQLQRALRTIKMRKFAVSAGEHFESELAIAVPVLAPDGTVAAALEADVEPSKLGFELCRAALLVAAGALGRDLEAAQVGKRRHLAIVPTSAAVGRAPLAMLPPVAGN